MALAPSPIATAYAPDALVYSPEAIAPGTCLRIIAHGYTVACSSAAELSPAANDEAPTAMSSKTNGCIA